MHTGDLHESSLAQLSRRLRARELSCVELTQTLLDRIRSLDAEINSFITLCPEQALEQARAADRLIERQEGGVLTGIPLAHKDIFCTRGIRTSCASRMLDNFIAPYESTVTARLREAGAINLGKLNMDEFAMGSSNETSFYGPVRNPWDRRRIPGGSSGGSAAAVAARLVPGATGSDTGGSIRQPAALCGVTGLKPTYGRVSRWGMIAFASSMDQAGILARSAEDVALLLGAMAGFDERDATCANRAVPDYLAQLERPLAGLRIGLPKEYFQSAMDAGIAEEVQKALDEYSKLGALVQDISLPHTRYVGTVYSLLASAEASSNLARFDGAHFGYRCKDPQGLEDMYKRSRCEGFGRQVKSRILLGTYALSARNYTSVCLQAQKVRRLILNDFLKVFAEVDLIMTPTIPVPARFLDRSAGPMSPCGDDPFTPAVNLAGLPALSLPVGQVTRLPAGLQLIAPHFHEERLLNAAHQFQKVTDWHRESPPVQQGNGRSAL
ncbi:MAG: Asp-tRNA(Asn)/Glu-tRNA(Gln) amidotransferase subunit GatA [Kistimonas sp.]|nr:Asp-tRNA(Asn)/Glu-tRNA(Gln) amidotransferase subunit GatA [Kistimonas sp.]